jgi:hypothetical protein
MSDMNKFGYWFTFDGFLSDRYCMLGFAFLGFDLSFTLKAQPHPPPQEQRQRLSLSGDFRQQRLDRESFRQSSRGGVN